MFDKFSVGFFMSKKNKKKDDEDKTNFMKIPTISRNSLSDDVTMALINFGK